MTSSDRDRDLLLGIVSGEVPSQCVPPGYKTSKVTKHENTYMNHFGKVEITKIFHFKIFQRNQRNAIVKPLHGRLILFR